MPNIATRSLKELRAHVPFTALGALSGIVLMLFFYRIPHQAAYTVFYILHPLHVLLSALVTASLYRIHERRDVKMRFQILRIVIIGYLGSVGIATLSDSLIPYLGEVMLGLPNRHLYLGFIEEWWLINPLAFL